MQRPTYLQNTPDLSDRAVQGMGTVLPPHITPKSGQFVLVDGAGNKKLHGATLDFVVADIADHVAKLYYPPDRPWTPDSADPPECFSQNGIGPSRDAVTPQARTCAECPNNVRGSKISPTGASVKACRDEVLLAVIVPQYPNMLFQMKVTPGSFKNWRKHIEEAKNVSPGDHVGTILTRATFDPEAPNEILFKAVAYPDEATWTARTKAISTKSTDILVGRLDRPRELPAPAAQQVGMMAAPTTGGQLQGSTPPAVQDGFGQQAAPPATQAQPEPQKRHRRTKAEIAADEVAKTPQAPNPQPQMAPFRPDTPPAGNGAAFGINPNPPGPSADIQASLDAAFGAKPTGGAFGS